MKIKYIFTILILVILLLSLIGYGIYYSIRVELINKIKDPIFLSEIVHAIKANTFEFVIIFFPLIAIIVILISILIFRRFYEPEKKILKYLDSLLQYDLTVDINMKKEEELKKIIKLLIQFKEKLNKMIIEEKNVINNLSILTSDLLRELSTNPINYENISRISKNLLENIEKLQIISSRYKVKQ